MRLPPRLRVRVGICWLLNQATIWSLCIPWAGNAVGKNIGNYRDGGMPVWRELFCLIFINCELIAFLRYRTGIRAGVEWMDIPDECGWCAFSQIGVWHTHPSNLLLIITSNPPPPTLELHMRYAILVFKGKQGLGAREQSLQIVKSVPKHHKLILRCNLPERHGDNKLGCWLEESGPFPRISQPKCPRCGFHKKKTPGKKLEDFFFWI